MGQLICCRSRRQYYITISQLLLLLLLNVIKTDFRRFRIHSFLPMRAPTRSAGVCGAVSTTRGVPSGVVAAKFIYLVPLALVAQNTGRLR